MYLTKNNLNTTIRKLMGLMTELQVPCGTGFYDILIGKGSTFNPQIIRKINKLLWNDLR